MRGRSRTIRTSRSGVLETAAARVFSAADRFGLILAFVLLIACAFSLLAELTIGSRLSVIAGERLAPRRRWLMILLSFILRILLICSGTMVVCGSVLWFVHLFQVLISMDASKFTQGIGGLAFTLLFCAFIVAVARSLFFVFVVPNEEDRQTTAVQMALTRARELASKARKAERDGKLYKALSLTDNAVEIYKSDVLLDRWWLARQQALLHWGSADIHKGLGHAAEALASYQQAQTLYDSDRIGPWLQLHVERFRLYLAMSDLASSLEDRNSWFRERSARMVEALEMAPPEQREDSPWEHLRRGFADFHARWLRTALTHGDLQFVPEVLAAVQGRDIAAEVLDKVEGNSVPGPVAEYQRVRQQLRHLAERRQPSPKASAQEEGSPPLDGKSNDDRREGTGEAISDEREDDAQETDDIVAYRKLHSELGRIRAVAAQSPGFELLAAPHRQLTAAGLTSLLAQDEALLLVFPDPETNSGAGRSPSLPDQECRTNGNAVLFRSDGSSVHIFGKGILEAATQMSEFAEACNTRQGMRKGGYRTTESAAERSTFDMGAGFWEKLENLQKNALWSKLTTHLDGVRRIVGATYGSLHQLSLSVGAPMNTHVVQYPGIVFFALKRGLFSRPIAPKTETRIEELKMSQQSLNAFGTIMGPEQSTSAVVQPQRIGILVDDGHGTIPMAEAEGVAVAEIWRRVPGCNLETPCLWPAGGRLSLLHVASHGALLKGRGPNPIPAIAIDDGLFIDERVIARGAPVDVVLLNICLGGRNVDDPLDGSPSGLVSGFLRAGSSVVIAALPPIPDLWAFVLGLLVTYELADGETRAEIALARAKERLALGNWPEALESAFRRAFEEAVIPQIAAHVRRKCSGLEDLPQDALKAAAECDAWWFCEAALFGLGPVLDATPEHQRLERVTERLSAAAQARLDTAIAARVPPPGDLGLLRHGIIAFGESQTPHAFAHRLKEPIECLDCPDVVDAL